MQVLRPYFVDSVYLIAKQSPRDNWWSAAEAAARDIPAQQPMVTSDGVMLETLAHFSRESRRFRERLVERFRSLRRNPLYTFVPHSQRLMESALDLYGGEFASSSLSLQDCVAIAISREYGITSILTADQEFARAGLNPLLLRYQD